MNLRLVSLALASTFLVSCAGSKPAENTQVRSDPLEGFNRAMFNFNYNVVDPYVLRPVAVAWRNYMPAPARTGLSNFLGNLDEPASMLNSLFRGKINDAGKHFTRFFLNSVLGLGGFIDVAGKANTELARTQSQRFGTTLGSYGVGYGPYVQLPMYGSFTLRQEGGNYADNFYPALSWLTFWMSAGKWMLEGIETRAELLDTDGLLRNSSDPYLFIREAYFQRNDFLANGGKLTSEENPNAQVIKNELEDIDSGN